jgi:twitching motility protein PilT
MPQLDQLIRALLERPAGAEILIVADAEPLLRSDGADVTMVRKKLSAAQIRFLVGEIAKESDMRALELRGTLELGYAGDGLGKVLVSVRAWNGQTEVEIRAASGGLEFDLSNPAEPQPAAAPAPRAPEPSAERKEPPAVQRPVPAPAQPAAGPRPARSTTSSKAQAPKMTELLRVLVTSGSSDLHLSTGEKPMIRKDGEMSRLAQYPVLTEPMLHGMLQPVMSERAKKFFGECNDADFAYELEGLSRFRGNVFRDRKGIGAVFRAIPTEVVTVEKLGLAPSVQNLCYLSKGLVLVTGPTGSGKSTTLCALVDLINRKRKDHVVTIEDPIEFVHPNKNCLINQREVGAHTDSFKKALRAALREDPDVVLVGEMRDLETIAIAIETAETGHLVFGTLHTSTAYSTIDRVIDQFPHQEQEQIRVMLSESLQAVIAQTLCKRIGGGRVAAREVLLVNPAIANLIREGKTYQIPSIMQTQRKQGMVLLNESLMDLVIGGIVEPREAYIKAIDKAIFIKLARDANIPLDFLQGEVG